MFGSVLCSVAILGMFMLSRDLWAFGKWDDGAILRFAFMMDLGGVEIGSSGWS